MTRVPIIGVAFALGLSVGACFDAPRPAVQFSCDPVDAPQCPPDYACEADGCCHLIGSDVAANEGQCQLGGALPTGGPPATSSGSGSGGSGSGSTAQGSDTHSSSSQGSSSQGSDTQGSSTQGFGTQGSDDGSGSTATSSSGGTSSSSSTG
ncbi:MAG: hypothetical protein AB1Z98_10120 [Nannocystaceae bacterium]